MPRAQLRAAELAVLPHTQVHCSIAFALTVVAIECHGVSLMLYCTVCRPFGQVKVVDFESVKFLFVPVTVVLTELCNPLC